MGGKEEQGMNEEGWGRWNLQIWRLMVAAISPLLYIGCGRNSSRHHLPSYLLKGSHKI